MYCGISFFEHNLNPNSISHLNLNPNHTQYFICFLFFLSFYCFIFSFISLLFAGKNTHTHAYLPLPFCPLRPISPVPRGLFFLIFFRFIAFFFFILLFFFPEKTAKQKTRKGNRKIRKNTHIPLPFPSPSHSLSAEGPVPPAAPAAPRAVPPAHVGQHPPCPQTPLDLIIGVCVLFGRGQHITQHIFFVCTLRHFEIRKQSCSIF